VDLKEWLTNALDAGRTALTEAESKTILDRYGVPVVAETVVTTADEAVAAAGGAGFPVVLKGIGEGLLHKTESGLVHLNLTDEQSVSTAAEQILQAAPGAQLLVQPQVHGKPRVRGRPDPRPPLRPGDSFRIGRHLYRSAVGCRFPAGATHPAGCVRYDRIHSIPGADRAVPG
jgi:hypothetical protein